MQDKMQNLLDNLSNYSFDDFNKILTDSDLTKDSNPDIYNAYEFAWLQENLANRVRDYLSLGALTEKSTGTANIQNMNMMA